MKNKPYNYSAKDRIKKDKDVNNTIRTVKSNSSKTNKDLSKTSTIKTINNDKKESNNKGVSQNTIRVDSKDLNDSNLLDTSFLEGRTQQKTNKVSKEKEHKSKDNSEALKKIIFIRKALLYAAYVLAVFLVVAIIYNNFHEITSLFTKKSTVSSDVKEKNVSKEESIIDDNYLFVGDFHSEGFNFDEFKLDYHYVHSNKSDLTVSHIATHGKEMIYNFNPSIVFIQVGFNDIENGLSDDDIISSLSRVVSGIKTNRPNAKIYIESVYPIDDAKNEFSNITNDRIKELNKKYKSLAIENEVHYLDIYGVLVKSGKLNSDYSNDGKTLNTKGYKQVLNVIKDVIG